MKRYEPTAEQQMAVRFAKIAQNRNLYSLLVADLDRGLRHIGVPDQQSQSVSVQIVDVLKDARGGVAEARMLAEPLKGLFMQAFKARSSELSDTLIGAAAKARITAGKAIDWGTGTGLIADNFEKVMPNLRFQGCDVNDYRVNRTRPFFQVQQNKIPVEDNSFDLAVVSYMLHHDPNPAEVIQELQRILKKGAKALVVELNPKSSGLPNGINFAGDKDRVSFSDFLFCQVWQNVEMPMPCSYMDVDSWRNLFERNGFANEAVVSIEGTPQIYGDRNLFVLTKKS